MAFVDRGDRGPGVLLCHPWWGVSEGVIAMADCLAAAGFRVTMPDLYAGRRATTIEEAGALRTAVPLAVRQARFDEAVEHLLAAPGRTGDQIGLVGLSMGAAWALALAHEDPGPIAAVVLYYGTGDEHAFEPRSFSLLGHFADRDEWERDEGIAALDVGLSQSGIRHVFHRYPGTAHWFAESDVPGAYNPDAAATAMERTIAFLTETLRPTASVSG